MAADMPDLQSLWMPFTANRQFKAAPRLLVSAKGMYYTDADGHRLLDGTAGLWCCNAGHGREEIIEAVHAQMRTLDYAPPFQMGHPLAFEAARRLAALMPAGLDRIFFTNSGSESVDTALKIVLAYHRARGEGQRMRFIGRERGYHGVGFGGMSVGGIGTNRKAYAGNLMPGVDHLPATLNIAEAAYSRGQPAWGAHLAEELERLLALHDPSTVAGVIVEPMAGSAGVIVPPVGYLERLRELCTRHGIPLIFDEVITDLLTMAKGVNNAAIPMGAVAVSREIHDTIMAAGPGNAIELFHGYTYSGHPAAAAAAVATLDLYEKEGLFARAARLEPVFESAVHGLRGAPHVKDIRNIGMAAAIELEPRAGQPGARAYEAFLACLKAGVLVRFTGDILAFSPPLIIDEEQIGALFSVVKTALNSLD